MTPDSGPGYHGRAAAGGWRVQLAGALVVRRGTRALSGTDLGSRKARRLVALLAVEGGAPVTVDRIVDVLWPERAPANPAENVATLVSRVRAAVGTEIITGGRGGYRLGPDVATDLTEAARLGREARSRLDAGEPTLAATAAAGALALLTPAPVLVEEGDAEWAAPARLAQERQVRQARQVFVAAALAVGDVPAALLVAQEAVDADPLDEPAHRDLMRAQRAAGDPARALAAYAELAGVLADELGTDPAPETRELHTEILREREQAQAPPPAGTASGRDRDRTFVGRDGDLALLDRAWTAAAGGRPGVVLVTGPAGIGKTRLAMEASASADRTGGLVARARCYELERSLFLQPVVEALTPVVTSLPPAMLREAAGDRADELGALLPEIAAVLGARPADTGTAERQRLRAYDAVIGFLRRLSAHRPILLFLDDLHDAGLATVELLHYTARHAGAARLLVVATVRTDDADGAAALAALGDVAGRVDVHRLSTRDIEQLATASGHRHLVGEIERRTRGHTLFVVQTLHGLASGEEGIPADLRAAVLSRVARAGRDAEDLLRAAACLGTSFDPAVVAGLLDIGAPDAARRCERLLGTHLVTVSGRSYEFGNDLIQEVLYDTTPAPTRTVYHARAADLLAGNPDAVGRHAAAAGDLARAARGWLLAGERAAQRYAVGDAEALLDRAIAAAAESGDDEVHGRACLARGRVREIAGRYVDAFADYTAAREFALAAGDQRLEMVALRRRGGPVAPGSGRPRDESTADLMRSLQLARVLGDRVGEAEVLGWLAVASCNELRFDEAMRYGRLALAAARGTGDERAVAAALDGLKTGYAYLGELAELATVLTELEPLVHRSGDLYLLQWCVFESALPMIGAGDWVSAQARISDALAVNRRNGYRADEPWFVVHLAWVARLAGRPDEAAALGERALALGGHAWWAAVVASLHARTLVERGETQAAVALLESGLAALDGNLTRAYRLRCLAPLAEVTGSPELLAEADLMLREITAPSGSMWLFGIDAYLSVARAHLAAGDPARAGEIVEELLATGARTGWVAPLAEAVLIARRCRAALAGEPA